ncbi:centromere protein C isoform X2 [Peromyscus maniculatus bairdii]|uniref:centromere protein C isoform X2 n=1 Tax=Peromyscus maniculatus bairdii TaxID=230844 RepID=UPI00042AEFF8|nr:centromere protein C isoform X2 [Peromyscus maniculatus bairdii]
MASFHLDHLKNYHRRFCRPSRAPNIQAKQGQNVLDILQDCFEEQNSPESLRCSTPKVKDNHNQSAGKECQASCSKSVLGSSRSKEAFLQVAAELSEAAHGSVQANEVHPKIPATDVSKSTADSNNMSSKKTNGHHSATNADFVLPGGSPVVLLGAKASELQNVISSLSQKRVASVLRNSGDTKSSNTDISLKTRKRLNFEDKSILNKAEIENNVLEEDSTSEVQEGIASETSQRRQDLSNEIQPRSKKSFSALYLETVKRKSESSSIVRHTTAVRPLSSPPNDMKLLEDEFIIDESDRSFASQPWVTIPRKSRPLRQHLPSPENIGTPKDKKSREKPHSVSAKTLISGSQSHKAPPKEKSQPSVENLLGISRTDELENDCRSTENKMHSENAKEPSGSKRTVRQQQRRASKPTIVEEQVNVQKGRKGKRNMPNTGRDKSHVNSERNMEDCEEVRNEPVPKKQMLPVENKKKKHSTQKDKEKSREKCVSGGSKDKCVPDEVSLSVRRSCRISHHPSEWWLVKPEEGSVNRSSSRENESSGVDHNRRKRAKKNQLPANPGKKPFPSKRQKTESSSRVQKSSNVKGSRGSVSHDEISGSQSEPLENNEADPTQMKSLDISGPTRGSKYQNSIMTSQNVRLKSHTGKYTSKTPIESISDSGEPKNSIWEESGPSRFKDHLMSGSSNSDVGGEKESLDLRIRSSNVPPDGNIHHKFVLPSRSPNVRRTKRIRLKPLEYWRGERIDYQERPSGRIVIGILSPPPVSPRRKSKRNLAKVTKKANRKRIHRDNYEKDRLVVNLDITLGDPFQATLAKDPETREIVPMDLIRPRDTYQFFMEQHGLQVFKTMDTAVFSTGKLVLGPHEEKGKQHVGQDILIFYVNFGDLLCTLHETPYMITTGDSFYVPSGNHYNIKNLLDVESCLLFTQIKR